MVRYHPLAVDAVEADGPADSGKAVGIDMNARQVAVHDGTAGMLHAVPDLRRLDAGARRCQRIVARRRKGGGRRAANVRHNRRHHVPEHMAGKASTVAVEDLETGNMTASAKGTAERCRAGT